MLRIVSLIASATEIVHGLGLTARQVGRSHECDYPAEVVHLPVCTAPAFSVEGTSAEIDERVKARVAGALSVYTVFQDVLERLEPTHIVTQMCFRGFTTANWARQVKRRGVDLPIRIGLPGAVTRQKLARISASIGPLSRRNSRHFGSPVASARAFMRMLPRRLNG